MIYPFCTTIDFKTSLHELCLGYFAVFGGPLSPPMADILTFDVVRKLESYGDLFHCLDLVIKRHCVFVCLQLGSL